MTEVPHTHARETAGGIDRIGRTSGWQREGQTQPITTGNTSSWDAYGF
jgi:hypothetical protein